MKGVIKYLSILLLVFLSIDVYASEYKINTLIPVDSLGTVNTDKFNYIDFVYQSQLNAKGNATLKFASIKNNSLSKTAVSINVLLFDGDKKNIGFLTYCSDKDLSSDNYGFKLSANEALPFSINVTDRYFANDKKPGDVKFIAVMDENKYCQIGGYDNYVGYTIEEIVNGDAVANSKKGFIDIDIDFSFLKNKELITPVLIIIGIMTLLIIIGSIINSLYKKMEAKTTIFAYIPVVNIFIGARLAFGKIVSLGILVLYLVSIGLSLTGISLFYGVVGVISIAVIVVDIIKIVTNKYDMFIINSKDKNVNTNFQENNNSSEENKILDLSFSNNKPLNADVVNSDNNTHNSMEESLDLTYSDKTNGDKQSETSSLANLYEEVTSDNSSNNESSNNNELQDMYIASSSDNEIKNDTGDINVESSKDINMNNDKIEDLNMPLSDISIDNIENEEDKKELEKDTDVDIDSLYDSINTDSDDDIDDLDDDR